MWVPTPPHRSCAASSSPTGMWWRQTSSVTTPLWWGLGTLGSGVEVTVVCNSLIYSLLFCFSRLVLFHCGLLSVRNSPLHWSRDELVINRYLPHRMSLRAHIVTDLWARLGPHHTHPRRWNRTSGWHSLTTHCWVNMGVDKARLPSCSLSGNQTQDFFSAKGTNHCTVEDLSECVCGFDF